jgi:hypothetical protein
MFRMPAFRPHDRRRALLAGVAACLALTTFSARPANAQNGADAAQTDVLAALAQRLAAANEAPAGSQRDGAHQDGADQAGGAWEAVAIPGATCGRGDPFKYYLNKSSQPEAGIFFLLNGGGVCLKEGHAPAGTTGVAQQLYCMDFSNFVDPIMNDTTFLGLGAALIPTAIPYFNRNDRANPFRDYHFVAVPYCTGDVHAGRMSTAYDYDPDPGATFEVTHRGNLNFVAVVEDLFRRYPADMPVVLSGVSAGGFGAIYNFPEVIERWPHTVLLPDSGIAPPNPASLLAQRGAEIAARWGARGILPPYCATDDCLADSLRLLTAHADNFNGVKGPWRPFGYLQSQQDATLVSYLELTSCGFQVGLRHGRAAPQPANLRAYVPATNKHVFSIVLDTANPLGGARPFVSKNGVGFLDWFRQVATATAADGLPADAIDPWLPCNSTFLPAGVSGVGLR